MLLLMENDQTFDINLNDLHLNGMTPFDLAVHYDVRLLYTLESRVREVCNFARVGKN